MNATRALYDLVYKGASCVLRSVMLLMTHPVPQFTRALLAQPQTEYTVTGMDDSAFNYEQRLGNGSKLNR
jgi:hypothetical protein